MITKIQKLDNQEYDIEELEQAAQIIRAGGLVAFPTETVYGLGGNALDGKASEKIYAAKGRPSDNPLIVHISKAKDIEELAKNIPDQAYRLAEVFWPGPLTMILYKNSFIPDSTTGGLDTVAIRLPANKIARDLIEKSGTFIAAPSANLSGKPSPTKAKHVIDDLDGKIDMIIDGGNATLGLESTIVDLTSEEPMLLRPGCITKKMLENTIGPIGCDPAIISKIPIKNIIPKAPGMKYRHYAPEGSLTIYEGNTEDVIKEINDVARSKVENGSSVGIIATEETKQYYNYGEVMSIGSRNDESSIAAGLYSILRQFDELHTEHIFTESFENNAFGQAIMNRLIKAAGYRIINVSR